VLRIFRISRLFKLLKSKRLDGIKKILKTLKYAFSGFVNLFALLAIVLFIYSVMGVFLFRDNSVEEIYQNEWVNFDNFGWAMLTMFRCSTGEDWHQFMVKYSSGSTVVTYLFFISFELITNFILLNLLVLVVINQFEEFYFNKHIPLEII
jgi:hypothetical protein